MKLSNGNGLNCGIEGGEMKISQGKEICRIQHSFEISAGDSVAFKTHQYCPSFQLDMDHVNSIRIINDLNK